MHSSLVTRHSALNLRHSVLSPRHSPTVQRASASRNAATGIAGGHELLAEVAIVAGGRDCAHDRGVVQLLGVVDLVAAGVAAGVVVADVGVAICGSCGSRRLP